MPNNKPQLRVNMKSIKHICFLAALIALFVVLDMLSIRINENIKITFGGLPILVASLMFGPISGLTVGLVGAFLGQLLGPYGITPTTPLWILPAGMRGLTMGLIMIALRRLGKLISAPISINALSRLGKACAMPVYMLVYRVPDKPLVAPISIRKHARVQNARAIAVHVRISRNMAKLCAILTAVLISSLVVTALNTLAMYVDSKLYNYYSYALVFGVTAFRLLQGLITSVCFVVLLIPIERALKKII